MSTIEVSPVSPPSGELQKQVVNDFSIQVATVNGSGSQTANNVLMRSIFQMGIPVSGKNMFPSNIQGLPTWFTIRASKHGYIGRKKEIDFLVAMNPETAREDVMKLDAGAAVVYDEPLKLNALRSDLHFYPVPYDKLVGPVCPEAKLRKLVRNMIYDGIVAWLLSIEMEEIHKALFKQFGKRKAKAAELNWGACQAGYEYASKTFTKTDPYRVERMSRPPVDFERLLIGLVGGFQPDKLAKSFDGDADGIYARVLFSWPTEAPYRPLTDTVDAALSEVVKLRGRERLLELLCDPSTSDLADQEIMAGAWAG